MFQEKTSFAQKCEYADSAERDEEDEDEDEEGEEDWSEQEHIKALGGSAAIAKQYACLDFQYPI